MEKKLYRSNTDSKVAGICGGLAEYFNLDSSIVRLVWIVFTIMYGFGLIAYIIAALVIPKKPDIL